MSTTPTYDLLLQEVTDDLERTVLSVFLENAGKRLTREELVFLVFGHLVPGGALANNADDRKIREAIERLQQRKFPILSSSGQAGYIMAIEDKELDAYVAEIVTRQLALQQKAEALRASRFWIPFIRAYKEKKPAEQPTLFSLPRQMP